MRVRFPPLRRMAKYLIITGSKKHPPIKKVFLSLREARVAYSNMDEPVSIGKDVLEDDGSVRDITDEEQWKIIDISDEYDSSK